MSESANQRIGEGDEVEIRRRYVVQVGEPKRVSITLVGCGGTGSFLALHLARLAYHARDRQRLEVGLRFVDPDVVEGKNIGRQNFCPAEVGRYKALTLMARYNLAFGLNAEGYAARFRRDLLLQRRDDLCLVIGCVDDGQGGRRTMAEVCGWAEGRIWWLDCGNHEQAGQVVIGNRGDLREAEISPLGFCSGLPLPSVVHPELLGGDAPGTGAGSEEGVWEYGSVGGKGVSNDILSGNAPGTGAGSEGDVLSCAEMALADVQSLMVNQAVAGWAAQYVYRLVLARDLDVWGTYVDLATGSARSVGICDKVIG